MTATHRQVSILYAAATANQNNHIFFLSHSIRTSSSRTQT